MLFPLLGAAVAARLERGDAHTRRWLSASVWGFLAAPSWIEAGKAAIGAGPDVPVLCLCANPHHFAYLHDGFCYLGANAVIVQRLQPNDDVVEAFSPYFESVSPLDILPVSRGGRVVMLLGLYRAKHFRKLFPTAPPWRGKWHEAFLPWGTGTPWRMRVSVDGSGVKPRGTGALVAEPTRHTRSLTSVVILFLVPRLRFPSLTRWSCKQPVQGRQYHQREQRTGYQSADDHRGQGFLHLRTGASRHGHGYEP